MTHECPTCGTLLDNPRTDPLQRVKWGARLVYAQRALRGMLRPVGPVDVSHLEREGYMEGRVRIQVRPSLVDPDARGEASR